MPGTEIKNHQREKTLEKWFSLVLRGSILAPKSADRAETEKNCVIRQSCL